MAKYRITGPDGGTYVVNAPDGASEKDVLAYVQRNASAAPTVAPSAGSDGQPMPSPSSPSSNTAPADVNGWEDAAKSVGSGLVKGVLGIGSLPGNIEHLGRMGIDYGARKLGFDDPELSKGAFLPHYGHYKADLERRIGMPLYDAKTGTGKVLETAASFATGAGAVPGTLAQKTISGVVGPTIGTEVAGHMAEGTDWEPAARVAGAIIGAKAAPIIADATNAVARGASAPIRAVVNPEKMAAEKVGEALARDLTRPGTTPTAADIAARAGDRFASMSGGNRSVRLADVGGENTQGLMRAAINMPNDARQGAKKVMDARQGSQWSRIETAADKGLAPGKRMEQTVDDWIAARDAAATPAFQQAFATPTPLTQNLVDVLNRPTMQKVGEKVQLRLQDEGKALTPANNTEWLHRVKLELDDLIGQSKLAEKMGNTPQAGFDTKTLVVLKNDLLNSINHPTYKRALKDYAGPSALKTAAKRGEDEFLTSSPHEIRKTLAGMSPSEQEAYRMGGKQAMFTRMEGPNVTRDLTDGMFGSAGIQARLAALFPDRKALREFQKALITEAKMADTRKAAQGNSTTAKQLAEGSEAGKNATMLKSGVQAVGGLATGKLTPAFDFLSQTYNRFSGLTPNVASKILQLQMSRDPNAALRAIQSGLQRSTAAPIREQGFTRGIASSYQTVPEIDRILSDGDRARSIDDILGRR